MEKVLILLASFNGETFIREQLDSIIAQTYSDWELIIQDDGSTDNTVNIVKEYTKQDSRICLCHNDSNNHGPFANFHILANRFKGDYQYDYYMFSDQDDIWDANKMEKMIRSIKRKVSSETPALVYADMRLIDSTGKTYERSIDEAWKISGKNAYSYFFSHKVFGCNLMMNASLFHIVPILNEDSHMISKLSHDNLYAKYAATFGKIWFLHDQTMGYRRHGENQTTSQNYHIDVKRIIDRIFKLKRLAEKHSVAYGASLYTIDKIKIDNDMLLTDKQVRFLDEIENIINRGSFYSLRGIMRHRVKWGGLIENISHTLIIILGMHKDFLSEWVE